MRFVEIINHKKFTLFLIFSCLYLTLNLIDGERGLISYFEKQKIKKELINKKKIIENKILLVEKKNDLLTNNIDLDYLEILYRKHFMVGKTNEDIYSIK